MNVAFFLKPKAETAYLYDHFTVRQALEKMHYHRYTAIPVINDDGKYVGVLSEGDFLWYIIDGEGGEIAKVNITDVENIKIKDALTIRRPEPAKITATAADLIGFAMNQNFVCVVDDMDSFIGIVTRRDIIRYFYEKTSHPMK